MTKFVVYFPETDNCIVVESEDTDFPKEKELAEICKSQEYSEFAILGTLNEYKNMKEYEISRSGKVFEKKNFVYNWGE